MTHSAPDALHMFFPGNISLADIITQHIKNNPSVSYVFANFTTPNSTIAKEQMRLWKIASKSGWKELTSYSGNIAAITEIEKQIERKLYQVRINFVTDGEANIKIGVQAKITSV